MVLTPDDYKKTLDTKHKSDHRLEILPKSLEEAVLVFVLAKALRLWRGHDKKHCTMMVNVSRFNRVQQDAHTLIQAFLKTVQKDIYENAKLKKYPKNSVLHELRRLYQEEFLAKATPEQKPNYPDWYDLDFFKSVRFMKVATVNMSSEPLNYDREPDGLTVIAIGGLALSRGLTLEGLTVSYILRNASAYDTLMQMGRWFGYRPDYEDLCRLYIPKESKDHYKVTAEAITELREELKHMQDLNKTPADFGLKVRRHPSSFAITAANKMKTAQTVTHFHNLSGMNIEGHSLYKDDSKNSHNRKLVSNFIQTLGPAIEGEMGLTSLACFGKTCPSARF